MVIDTSAPAATFFAEPERTAFVRAITAAARRLISAASVLETGIVLEGRQGENAGREFDLFKSEASKPAPFYFGYQSSSRTSIPVPSNAFLNTCRSEPR